MGRTTRMRRAAGMLLLSLLMGACGQFGSAHRSAVLQRAAVASPAADPSVSPNGENSGPAPNLRYRVIVVRHTVKGFPRRTGVLKTCPVHGTGFFSDDFGYPRFAGGYHPHGGNDIFADGGTPVVAPFGGTAVADPNVLGGNAVKVFGSDGFVYNAHLSAYGRLGPVKAGDVIGYVGSTGDADGGPPHDHFEWHPGNGPAVDPYPYLVAACATR